MGIKAAPSPPLFPCGLCRSIRFLPFCLFPHPGNHSPLPNGAFLSLLRKLKPCAEAAPTTPPNPPLPLLVGASTLPSPISPAAGQAPSLSSWGTSCAVSLFLFPPRCTCVLLAGFFPEFFSRNSDLAASGLGRLAPFLFRQPHHGDLSPLRNSLFFSSQEFVSPSNFVYFFSVSAVQLDRYLGLFRTGAGRPLCWHALFSHQSWIFLIRSRVPGFFSL